MQEALKYFSYPKKSLTTKTETVDMIWKFLQYCKLLDKTSCDISKDIWNFSQYFNILFFIPRFLAVTLMIFFEIPVGKYIIVIREVIPHSRRQIQRLETRSLIDSIGLVHADLSVLGNTRTVPALSQCFISISDGSAEGKIKVQKAWASKQLKS